MQANGRVDDIGIFDHGAVGGQELGPTGNWIVHVDWEDLAPYLEDGALLRLYGCKVGKDQAGMNYCNWGADDAGPEARVIACDGDVAPFPDGHMGPVTGAQWITFDGVDHGYHP